MVVFKQILCNDFIFKKFRVKGLLTNINFNTNTSNTTQEN